MSAASRTSAAPTPAPPTPASSPRPAGLPGPESPSPARVSPATVARLPLYLRALSSLVEEGIATVSSDALAGAAGVTGAQVRKDLSQLGSYGTRGVGYDVTSLADEISRELGLTQARDVVLIGIGNLGRALAGYGGFRARGFRIAGLLDVAPACIGTQVDGVPVRALDELEAVVAPASTAIGVIATPGRAAQDVCDRLVAAGVRSILNFAPVVLAVPDGVEVRKVDLAVELQILSFHEARRGGAHAAAPLAAVPVHVPVGVPAPPAGEAAGVLVR